jgi:hypothetical protein
MRLSLERSGRVLQNWVFQHSITPILQYSNAPASPFGSLTYFLHYFYNWAEPVVVYCATMKTQFCRMIGVALATAATTLSAPAQPLEIHEWGTFTSLQDEAGRTLGGINSDDEPVPGFCHDANWALVARPSELPPVADKGAARCHPDVTMRLETPVLYFHLPPGESMPQTASVKVSFRGGWLTQFYPAAETSGLANMDRLTETATSSLSWNDLKIGVDAAGPQTSDRVWTAPRAVQAASVTTANGESEKFLFYRGVGHLASPLQVRRTADAASLAVSSQLSGALSQCTPLTLQHLWLVSIHPDGACAFRALAPAILQAPLKGQKQPILFSVPAEFSASAYPAANLSRLKSEMHAALREDGLFPDEADALLNTWEVSYFKSPGQRLFFMMPKGWTDWYLPLEVSVPCEVKRAMIGRLELVTPQQRALLKTLAKAAVPTQSWAHFDMSGKQAIVRGTMPQAYHDLGRFRNALLLDEYHSHPTPSLNAFIRLNGLEDRHS